MNAPMKRASFLIPLLILALMCTVGGGSPPEVKAKTMFYRCQVIAAGPMAESETWIMLRGLSPSFSDRLFLADPLRTREQLAVALVAISEGKDVYVQVDLDLPGKPPIEGLILVN